MQENEDEKKKMKTFYINCLISLESCITIFQKNYTTKKRNRKFFPEKEIR